MKEFTVYSSWLVVWKRITDSSEQLAGGGRVTSCAGSYRSWMILYWEAEGCTTEDTEEPQILER